jgi:nucleotide-binding universal stress UspA family protein
LPHSVTIEQEARAMYKRILVPIDGSPTSTLGLNEAIKLAKDQGAKLRLFHLVDEYVAVSGADGTALYAGDLFEVLRQSGKKIIEKAEALARRNGLTPESVMLESFGGRAADFIVQQANKWGADLIVLGTHGRRGVKRLVMGSDAEQVIRTTRVPVLLVRSKSMPRTSRKL